MTFIFDRLLHFFLKEEEVRRNSVMFDMLFVKLCHPLSVCISILDEKCKRLTDKERVEVKERIEPEKRFVAMFNCWTLHCFFVFVFSRFKELMNVYILFHVRALSIFYLTWIVEYCCHLLCATFWCHSHSGFLNL
jgi:hypothetical protein